MIAPSQAPSDTKGSAADQSSAPAPPSISLPKGGGAIRGIGEKFAANPVTGTGSMSVPIATSPGRSGFGPQLSLSYDSGAGNGPFGFGWSLSLPSITRKTDKGLPQYRDAEESDVFILSGAEDLVPVFKTDPATGGFVKDAKGNFVYDEFSRDGYLVRRFRPRIESLFARIERWTNLVDPTDVFWCSITKDNVTTFYGRPHKNADGSVDTNPSRVADPADLSRTFSWLICQSHDDKGNAMRYDYVAEDSRNIDTSQVSERNRTDKSQSANRYLKRILYGNATSILASGTVPPLGPNLSQMKWLFEVVFDYDDGHYQALSGPTDDPQFASALVESSSAWPVRADPFSSYRAGFEVRTYRLCHRVLMFHHFPQELDVDDCLVRSTEFAYTNSPVASFITTVTQSSYVLTDPGPPNKYLKKSLPLLEYSYSQVPDTATLSQQPVEEVDAESLENLPIGLDGGTYQWVDLDGEGTSGILTEQGAGWYYKRNLSPNNQIRENGSERTAVRLGSLELVSTTPVTGLASGQAQFLDLAGDGQLDVVQMEAPVRGFYERTKEGSWESFQPFPSWPNLSTRDPNLKFVDLTGDGHVDILIAEDDVFVWYPSLAKEGFGPAERTSQSLDEEKGPRMVFNDGTQSFYVADLSGDGLSDLARIRNGEVCYWPNLGYGRFGAKVTMDGAPWFDSPDQFDQRRIRLADTDGSGTTDILYLGRDGVQIYFNQSGNSWSDPVALPQFPPVDNIASVQALDLLGNGTACLVWSSPMPGGSRRPMRYLALMPEKPHLLVTVKNNLGAETRIHYASSTKFYLDDKQAGTPWITKLPFPVHVVESVETYDWVSRNRFVTRYKYHHGYFDGVEREFRGFGMVEHWDTEELASLTESDTMPDATNVDESSYVPPAYTKTWFHTGAWVEEGCISRQFEDDYYREGDESESLPGLTYEEVMPLPDTVVPTELKRKDGTSVDWTLTADETCEACRALKGATLRQEIFALDGTDESDRPYSASERNYTVELLQPRAGNKHAVFFTHAREQIDVHYERRLVDADGAKRADPRVSHAMTLEVDQFGNSLRALAIGYRRRDLPGVDAPEQKETHLTFTANRFANRPDEADWYRVGLPTEVRTYEVVNPPEPQIADTRIVPFSFESMEKLASDLFPTDKPEPEAAKLWPYEKWDWRTNLPNAPGEGDTRLRLIDHIRTVYRKDDLTGVLPLGEVESRALPGESYKLAFGPELISQVYGNRLTEVMLQEGGYIHSQGDLKWWIPSGRIFYSRDLAVSDANELTEAQVHFFVPRRFEDPFGNRTFADYAYDLLVTGTEDALQNKVTVSNNYRVLQPQEMIDPNGNHTEAAFNALGMVVGTAIKGKVTQLDGSEKSESGDSLDNFAADLTQDEIKAFFADPKGRASDRLGNATTRIIYDLDCFKDSGEPVFAAALARETHVSDPLPPNGLKIQVSFSYSDGFGREIQKKIQAEPGEVEVEDDAGNVSTVNTGPNIRWGGSGWTIFNNKGKPVRQYEPFFSTDHRFQFGKKVGVSSVLFYDPLERVVATLQPNHTYEKVVFDPWLRTTYDVNDTVTFDPKTDSDAGPFFVRLPDDDYLPTWHQQRVAGAKGVEEQQAAKKAVVHANTPTVVHFDSLGRTFLTVADNGTNDSGNPQKYNTRVALDVQGNQRAVRDAVVQNGDSLGRIVMRYDYDMLGTRIHQASMEAGERWMLNDVTGKPIRAWDSRGFMRAITYDELHRPTKLFVTKDGANGLAERTVYGESEGDAKNHRTRVYQVYDGVGIVTRVEYDFKGNVRESTRDLLPISTSKQGVDWSQNPLANDGTFTIRTSYDALNRPLTVTTPDGSVYRPTFNEANLLDMVDVNLRGAAAATHFVTNIDYNAKGQRELIAYGNSAQTAYEYDPLTFRLTKLTTKRPVGLNGIASQLFADPTVVQDLRYTYDPAGNITRITDAALKTIFFNGQRVDPICEYTYDAIYRLIEAKGREHIGQTAHDFNPQNRRDYDFVGLADFIANPNDLQAMRCYTESYEYDEVGNFKSVRHSANGGSWTRAYEYNEASLVEPIKKSNRLTKTTVGNGISFAESYTYTDEQGNDVHGCMTAINSMKMAWDFKDQLQQVDLGGGGRAFYVYDAAGQRARKVIETQNGKRKEERVYLGGFEVYREFEADGTSVELVRESLHVMDGKQRIALVETKTIENGNLINTPAPVQRFQLNNHLGSASVELSDKGSLICYEEFHPYGTTAFQVMNSAEVSLKRYRYIGKERDEETGFAYHGARYYSPWLGRWISADLAGLIDGCDLYSYARNNSVCLADRTGTDSRPAQKESEEKGTPVFTLPKPIPYQLGTDLPVDSSSIRGGIRTHPDVVAKLRDWAVSLTKDDSTTNPVQSIIDRAVTAYEGQLRAYDAQMEAILAKGFASNVARSISDRLSGSWFGDEDRRVRGYSKGEQLISDFRTELGRAARLQGPDPGAQLFGVIARANRTIDPLGSWSANAAQGLAIGSAIRAGTLAGAANQFAARRGWGSPPLTYAQGFAVGAAGKEPLVLGNYSDPAFRRYISGAQLGNTSYLVVDRPNWTPNFNAGVVRGAIEAGRPAVFVTPFSEQSLGKTYGLEAAQILGTPIQ